MMNNLMKSLALVVVIYFAGTMKSFAQTNVSEMLKDKQKKEQVFAAILENESLKKEMMTRLMKQAAKDSSTCKMVASMMSKDSHMMDMASCAMMDSAKDDKKMAQNMCMMMMTDPEMMKMMENMKKSNKSSAEAQKDKSNLKKHYDANKHPKGL